MAYGEELVGEWGPPPESGRAPIDDDLYIEQFRANCLRSEVPVLKLAREHKRIMVMVCGGPTSKTFLEDIRKKRQDDRYRIFCSNKTHDWLIENGIIPHYEFIIDPKESKVHDIEHPHKDVTYLIGVSCNPKVFDGLKGHKVFRVISLSGTTSGKVSDIMIAESVFKKGEWAALEGGTMAGLRAMCLGRVMGFKTVEFYGFDSCFFENADGGEPIYYAYDKGRNENIIECKCDDGRIFLSTPVFASQAREFIKWKHRLEWMKFIVYGDGFIAHLHKLDDELNRPKTDLLISPYMMTMNKQLYMKDERFKKMWGPGNFGISGAEYAGAVSLLAGQLAKKYGKLTMLDYGCGEGTLFKAMPDIVGLETIKYDPCIEGLDKRPEPADIVICTDVLEHVEPECVENVLNDLQKLTKIVCFISVCLTPAAKTYADGRNAHLTLMEHDYWYAKFRKRFDVLENRKEKNAAGHEKFICVCQALDPKLPVRQTDKTTEQLAKEYDDIFVPLIANVCSKCEDTCCSECANENGYLKGDSEKLKQQYGFDAKDGFLDKNTMACKIPRQLRSVHCQSYICERGREYLGKDKVNNVEKIDACMRYAREAEGMLV